MELKEKLLNIQLELNVSKNHKNYFGGYNYRNCEDILEAVKPLCSKYKTTLMILDEIESINGRFYVRANVILTDIEGDGEFLVKAFAREEESKKGMDASQITGAASSYARKYALNGLFLIDDTKDADTMENTVKPTQTKKETIPFVTNPDKEMEEEPEITRCELCSKALTVNELKYVKEGQPIKCYKCSKNL
jgi:hypothetical protein